MEQETRTVVFLGAGFSKAITAKTARPLPLSAEVLSNPYWVDALSYEDLQADLSISLPGRGALEDVLCLDFACDMQVRPDRGFGQWVLRGTTTAVNFENVYAHCLLHSTSPYLSVAAQNLNRTALLLLQVLVSRALDATRCGGTPDLALLNSFIAYARGAQSPSAPSRVAYFTTNFDNLIETAHQFDPTAQYRLSHGLSLEAAGMRGTGEIDAVLCGTSAWDHGPSYRKLHGSISYFTCSNPDCPLSLSFHSHANVRLFERSCPECGGFVYPGIVPPTTMKDYRSSKYSLRFVSGVYTALRAATRVIIVGYSFPAHDSVLNSRIFNGIKDGTGIREIAIIDKFSSGRIAARLRGIAADDCEISTYRDLVELPTPQ